jgi:uncharacterized protein YnzC (UPF0291/DUF896 family)
MEGMSITANSIESDIWERAIAEDNDGWSPDAARAILVFRLAEGDLQRADELAARARSGSLTAEEEEELEAYLRAGRLVELMKAKALLSLKKTTAPE